MVWVQVYYTYHNEGVCMCYSVEHRYVTVQGTCVMVWIAYMLWCCTHMSVCIHVSLCDMYTCYS